MKAREAGEQFLGAGDQGRVEFIEVELVPEKAG